MRLDGKLVTIPLALLLGAALGGTAQAPPKATPEPIVLEVTWELTVSGYKCHAGIMLQASYEVHPWTEFRGGGVWGEALPTDVCGGDAEASCFVLKYRGGSLVSSSGKNSVGDAAIFTEEAEVHPHGPEGLIRPTPDGSIEIVLYRQPGFKADNMAAEEALGCWSKDWPTPKISDSELRNLHTLRRQWENPAADAEFIAVAPGCEPGQARIAIRAKGKQECEPLKTACEQAKRWAECALANLRNALGLVTQARIDLTAEQASYQAQRLPAPPWFTQFELELDRLQQAVVGAQPKVTASRAESQADCALLPGPDNKEECEQAAARVEETTKKARAALKSDLDREMSVLEASAAVPVAARNKLLAQLRATLVLLYACE